ncbi:hypothetical protein HPB51_020384 [Rhipicephalus microplus]|uniref:Uncharacterized protein n=1 Tax=Rhipicephalus microplus TaxID=6941 RepID=A0A9J6DXC8_RHIMP|nr:hypothetical protein HPB51_020384 [Rhipicephalus microplus]
MCPCCGCRRVRCCRLCVPWLKAAVPGSAPPRVFDVGGPPGGTKLIAFSRHMEVDEAYPGPSRAPESLTADADASGVSSRQAKDDEPVSVDATLGNETGDATCSERRGWTEDAWHTVLSRRQKKNQLKKQQSQMEKAVKANEKFESDPPAEKQNCKATQGFRRRKRRGPPPLPKEDIKIILSLPYKGLWVKNILGLELSRAVIDACQ